MTEEYKAKVIALAQRYYDLGYSKFDSLRKAEADLRLSSLTHELSDI